MLKANPLILLPGFRSLTRWKMVIAVIGYLFLLGTYHELKGEPYMQGCIIALTFINTGAFYSWEWLPILRKGKIIQGLLFYNLALMLITGNL